MKVLQLLPSLQIGGVERGVIDLARAMKKAGHETVVISSGGELVGELQKMGVQHYTLPVHEKSFFVFPFIGKIVEIIERERVDIVHARSRVPAWLGWFAARRAGVPFVTTCHGYYSNHPFSQVMGWGKRVIVISRVIGRRMIDNFGVSPERIRLIHRGVDLSQFQFNSPHPTLSPEGRGEIERTSPKRRGKIESTPSPPLGERAGVRGKVFRIINIGRLSPIKGQVEFLKAIHVVRRTFPSIEAWIVGSEEKGKTKYTEQIEQTIRQLNLESCVKLLGTRRDISELLSESDLLVLSTLVPEAFGRVVVEAGAVGTPVIATGVGGVLDILDHGENGLLVPPGEPDAMAQAILEIIQNPGRAAEFADKLREKVEHQFSLEKMVQHTLAVYQEVLSEKKILILKLGAMGDLILATPSFRMIRQRFPNASICLLVDRKLAPLISASPYLNEIIPVDRKKMSSFSQLFKVAKRIRREGFDLSVDLQNSKWTHFLAFVSGIRERFGFKRGLLGFLLNRPDNTFEVADSPVRHQFRILSKMGVRQLDESLELWSDPDSEERVAAWLRPYEENDARLVGFVLGSSPRWLTKRWPLEYFEELAKKLIKQKCMIVLIGSSEEGSIGNDFRFKESKKIVNLTGKTSLRDLIPLMKRLDVLVTGDTAPLHVASAVHTKVVALFGPTDPKRHMLPGNGAIVLNRHLSCQPCYRGDCRNPEILACLKQIPVDEVFQAVQRQLALSLLQKV